METPVIFLKKQCSGEKLDLLSLPEAERIRVCREIRNLLKQKILEKRSENPSTQLQPATFSGK